MAGEGRGWILHNKDEKKRFNFICKSVQNTIQAVHFVCRSIYRICKIRKRNSVLIIVMQKSGLGTICGVGTMWDVLPYLQIDVL